MFLDIIALHKVFFSLQHPTITLVISHLENVTGKTIQQTLSIGRELKGKQHPLVLDPKLTTQAAPVSREYI